MSELIRMSMSIEKPLYNRLEKMVKKSGYSNRSEFMRDMIRDHMVEESWEKNEEALGTITLVYDHHARGLSEKLTHLQHHHHGEVLAATHLHLDHHHCAEMILVKGRAREIRTLTDQMRQLKGILHANLSISSTGKKLS